MLNILQLQQNFEHFTHQDNYSHRIAGNMGFTSIEVGHWVKPHSIN